MRIQPLSNQCRGAETAMIGIVFWLQLISTAESSEQTDIYNFPMLGILQLKSGTATPPSIYITFGSVTAAHKYVVVAATENLCQLDPSGKNFIFRDSMRQNLYVTFGSDLMTPPDNYGTDKVRRFKVDSIYFGKSSKFTHAITKVSLRDQQAFVRNWEDAVQVAPNLNGDKLADITQLGYVLNPFGELQWDVALLILQSEIQWGPFILPIYNLLFHRNFVLKNFEKAWGFIRNLEERPHEHTPCVVPGWSNTGNNDISYHKVVYVRLKECAEAICGAYPGSCLRYLNYHHHICFKSLSFSDSCVLDQGAPLLCEWAPDFALGILVKTWDCGADGLPAVFTRVDTIAAFARLTDLDTLSAEEPKLKDPQYTLPPKD